MTDDLPARIIRIQAAHGVANKADWRVAELTAENFGTFSRGDTEQVAKACNVSVDTVGNWARAQMQYDLMVQVLGANRMTPLRQLPLSFFYRAYRYEAVPSDVAELMEEALAEGKSAGWFGAQMDETHTETPDYPARINKLVRVLERDAIVTDYYGLKSRAEERIANDIRESAKAVVEHIERLNAKISERE